MAGNVVQIGSRQDVYERWVNDNFPSVVEEDIKGFRETFTATTSDGQTVTITAKVRYALRWDAYCRNEYSGSKKGCWTNIKSALEHSLQFMAEKATAAHFRTCLADITNDWWSYANNVLEDDALGIVSFLPEPPKFENTNRQVRIQQHGDKFVAMFTDKPGCGFGASADEALGNLMRVHEASFGIEIVSVPQ